MIEVEGPATDRPYRIPQGRQVAHGPSLNYASNRLIIAVSGPARESRFVGGDHTSRESILNLKGTTGSEQSRAEPAPLSFGSAWRRARLTVEDRVARGKSARQQAPRSSHRHFLPAADRPDPISLIEKQAESRVQALVPIRYGRMLVSPFTFYRGAALIMAADLAPTPRSGVTVQLCGDAHLSNFGLFGTPERRMLFDINDFDETLPGPWEWDVKRLAASFEVHGRDRGFATADRRTIVLASVSEYRQRMRRAAKQRTLDSWYDHLEAGQLIDRVRQEARKGRLTGWEARAAEGLIAKARTRDSVRVFAKRAGKVDGELRILADPPLIVPIEDMVAADPDLGSPEAVIKKLIWSYRRTLGQEHHPLEEFRYAHAASKVVGVGSVGTRCYVVLMVGRDQRDPLFLQVKEARESVLERFLGTSEHKHHGQRVVAGQKLMQAASDIFLGWVRVKDPDGAAHDYYVRQLHDWKGAADVESLRVTSTTLYARLCGAALARAHARWGDRIAIASYLGKGNAFDRAIADFSKTYADQNERDFDAFARAVKSGRVIAQTGV